MVYHRDIHHRHTIRYFQYDYATEGAYFITICTHQRESLFGEIRNGIMGLNEVGVMVRAVWDELPVRFPAIGLDEFVIMPNHVHGIIWIRENEPDVMRDIEENVGVGLVPTPPMMNAHGPHADPISVVTESNNPTTNVPGSATRVGARPTPTSVGAISPTLGAIVGAFKSITTVAYIRSQKRMNSNLVIPKLWQRNYYERIIRNEAALEEIRRYILDNPSKWSSDEENPDHCQIERFTT